MFQVSLGKNAQAFSVYLPVAKAYDAPNGNWCIEGPLSNPSKDLQDETMQMAGLIEGLKTHKALDSPVDWDHLWERTRDPQYYIGRGIDTFISPHPKTGIDVPWMKSELMMTKEYARKAKEHYDAGLPLGYSIAGIVASRDPMDKSIITKPMVTSVAVTPVPVVSENCGTIQFVKSMRELGRVGPLSIGRVQFPVVPETRSLTMPLFTEAELRKAMDVMSGIPHAGPGASALAVEDLGQNPAIPRRRRRKKIHKSNFAGVTLGLVIADYLADVHSGKKAARR